MDLQLDLAQKAFGQPRRLSRSFGPTGECSDPGHPTISPIKERFHSDRPRDHIPDFPEMCLLAQPGGVAPSRMAASLSLCRVCRTSHRGYSRTSGGNSTAK
jgi:hypothetical protein